MDHPMDKTPLLVALRARLPGWDGANAGLYTYLLALARLAEDGAIVLDDDLELHSPVTHLPEHFTCAGSLVITNPRYLVALPRALVVRRSLHIGSGCPLEALPPDLRVGEDLMVISAPRLASLPPGLEVGNLILSGCGALAALPERLRVRGWLYIPGCQALGPPETALPRSSVLMGRLVAGVSEGGAWVRAARLSVIRVDVLPACLAEWRARLVVLSAAEPRLPPGALAPALALCCAGEALERYAGLCAARRAVAQGAELLWRTLWDESDPWAAAHGPDAQHLEAGVLADARRALAGGR
jgi:hypothetical protein